MVDLVPHRALLRRRRVLSRIRIRVSVAPALTAIALLTACGHARAPQASVTTQPKTTLAAGWRPLPASPLGARERPVAVTVGGRVLFVGGSDSQPCPPNASCAAPSRLALRDGAAYDPVSDAWTAIAPAPIPMGGPYSYHTAVVIGTTAYFYAPGHDEYTPNQHRVDQTFISYDASANRWTSLPPPPDDFSSRHLAAVSGRVAVFASTHATSEPGQLRPLDPVPSDYVYDSELARWSALPPDPHAPSGDRAAIAVGGAVVLLSRDFGYDGSTAPVTRTAVLEATPTGGYTWRSVADGQPLTTYGFVAVGNAIVNIGDQSADGGEVNNWGRRLYDAAQFDVATGRWSALPKRPSSKQTTAIVQGPVGGARHVALGDWLYDVPDRMWLRLPVPSDSRDDVTGDGHSRSAAWIDTPTGATLVVWAGIQWNTDPPGQGLRSELLSNGWRLDVAVDR